jgi:hypothetical protein
MLFLRSAVVAADDSRNKKLLFGRGRLDALKELKQQENVTAIMVNTDILSPLQQVLLIFSIDSFMTFFCTIIIDRIECVLWSPDLRSLQHRALHFQAVREESGGPSANFVGRNSLHQAEATVYGCLSASRKSRFPAHWRRPHWRKWARAL